MICGILAALLTLFFLITGAKVTTMMMWNKPTSFLRVSVTVLCVLAMVMAAGPLFIFALNCFCPGVIQP